VPFAVRAQSHIPGECPGVASSLVEHWLFGLIIGRSRLVRPRLREGTLGAGMIWPGTLLGPEGTAALRGGCFFWMGRLHAERPQSCAVCSRVSRGRGCVGWGARRSGAGFPIVL
jgi:hypothetical protein